MAKKTATSAPQKKAAAGQGAQGGARPRAQRAEARVLLGGEQAALAVAPQLLAQDAPLAPEREEDDEQHAEEGRHHHQEVGQEHVRAVLVCRGQARRGVPRRVQHDGQRETGGGREDLHPALHRLRRQPQPHARHPREEGVRERREDAAHDEDPERVLLRDGHAVVLDVLRHREAQADHRGVDDAVGHAVELVAPP
ncbi:MAG TPA: hypothetical protein VE642_02405, partial [Pyrinomonadaceae bacterium]|nr:hypothetical protein [Pyrinomonadaceae bacterium]